MTRKVVGRLVTALFPTKHLGAERYANGKDHHQPCNVAHVDGPTFAFPDALKERDRVGQRQNARFNQGEIFGLIGPNGAGKTSNETSATATVARMSCGYWKPG
jgi:hypothetical protein